MSGISKPGQPGDGDHLRFDAQTIDGGLAPDVGAAFQRFCFELLREGHPRLQRFPAAGRDGGIDLIDDGEAGRKVFECKHIGSNGLDSARSRWRSVEKSLETHLPSRSQSQYAPWWDEERPIRRYVFCISSTLVNQAQLDELRREIEDTFQKLANASPHLEHLADVRAEVLHWPDLLSQLDDALTLLFRWFPSSRPLGLVPVDRPLSKSVFSSFLHSSHLGYYSRDRHIAEHGRPDDVQIESEMEILNRLDENVGLIVTGSGGHGKTRLVHELGVLAQDEGWCVLRTAGPWRQESLDRLRAIASRPTRILLLLDYVEMQEDFNDVVNDLIAINETFGYHIRYIANCRSSFYPRVAHLPQHEEVPLAPTHGVEWFREFRHHVVRHILETGGVGVKARTLQVCRDVPVLAVFLVYLATTGREDDLRELLGERDFGSWLRRRLEVSFRDAEGRRVAPVVAQFPVRDDRAERLASREVLSTLEKDGWIEVQPAVGSDEGEREWSVVHDVLADQLLVSWLAERGSFARGEVEDLLDLAIENGTLASVISSLQRIRDEPEVEGIPFGSILRRAFDEKPSTWLIQAPNVLNSSLLSPEDAVSMLQSNEAIWRKHLTRWIIRQRIGWLAREVAAMPEPGEAIAVAEWLQRALEIEETDYLLRSGLLLSPAATANRAEKWINDKPTEFSTHFVISAWLAAGLPSEPIAASTLAWLEVHAAHPRAWHVIARWLNNRYGRGAVDAHVLTWLQENHTLEQGPYYILPTWLKQGGRREDVDRYVLDWLRENAGSPYSALILGSWIEAGADLTLAEPFLKPCLRRPDQPYDARTVYLSWLNRGGLVEPIQELLEAWIDLHAGKGGSWYVLDLFVRVVPKTPELADALVERWKGSPLDKGFGEVLHGWLTSGGPTNLPQVPLKEWLDAFGTKPEAGHVYSAWLAREDAPDEVKEAAMRWFLAHPTDIQAGYLSKHFVLKEEMGIDTVRAILRWCAAFPSHEDASWRLTQLRANLHRIEVWEEVLDAAEAVSRATLANPFLSTLQATQLTFLCTLLMNAKRLRTGVAGDRCDAILLDYIRHPSSFQHGDHDLSNAERPAFVQRVFSLALRGWLDVEADEPALERLLAWVREWIPRYRERALRCVYMAAEVLPA